MNNKLLQQIKNLASFSLESFEYEILINHIDSKKYNIARIYVDEIKDRLELISSFDSFNIVKKLQLENVDKLLDIVIDLTIINEEEYGEGRKVNKVTRRE